MKPRNAYTERTASKKNVDYSKVPSLTVQEQKESTDINNILKRFTKTGLIDHVNENEARYGEFAGISYHEHLTIVRDVQRTFNELPSDVRAQFDNNPQEWIEHISVPGNVEDMKDGVIDNPIEIGAEEAVTPTEEGSTNEAAR